MLIIRISGTQVGMMCIDLAQSLALILSMYIGVFRPSQDIVKKRLHAFELAWHIHGHLHVIQWETMHSPNQSLIYIAIYEL